jgi:hypothetical protein
LFSRICSAQHLWPGFEGAVRPVFFGRKVNQGLRQSDRSALAMRGIRRI